MSIIINTNISSMQGIRALNKSTGSLNQALERLSTGYRINSSKDDAACCAISASLRKDISSLTVAQSNAQMGQSMIDTANGSLSNISNLLQRMRDLTEQAANGTYGTDERNTMQTEISNLVTELYRTKNSTEFNGKQVLGTEETKMTEAEAEAAGYAVVKTAQELKTSLTSSASCKVMLFADIDLNDLELDETGSNWTPVSDFRGTFDGNGFTISNLKINRPDEIYQALMGNTHGATIKNVTLENVDVKGSTRTAGLVGYSLNNTVIFNCSVSGTISGTDVCTGGLVGDNNHSTVSNCTSFANVIGAGANTGGLVGLNYNAQIENSISSATVTGTSNTGGIAGQNQTNSTITNCISSATVNATGSNTGGVSGLQYNNSTISNCSSSGSVKGKSSVGGLVGANSTNPSVINSLTVSSVSGTTNVGAFIGTSSNETLSGNEYNSTINGTMKAIGAGPLTPTEEQLKDNTSLTVETMQKRVTGTTATSVNLQVGIADDKYSTIEVDTGFDIGNFGINISTEYGASMALAKIDNLMSKITNKQTELGAMSNRLMTAMEYQDVQKSANIATNSVIKDADFAKESSNYIKSQILQNTTASLLATANQNPSIALMLVTGTNLRK